MKYLLDTQAWLWSVLDHPRLSRRARAALSAVPPPERIGIAAIPTRSCEGTAPNTARARRLRRE